MKRMFIPLIILLCLAPQSVHSGYADVQFKKFSEDKNRFERHISTVELNARDLQEWDELSMSIKQVMTADWEKDALRKIDDAVLKQGADTEALLAQKQIARADWERALDTELAEEKGQWLARLNIVSGNLDRQAIIDILADARQLDITLDTFSQWDDYVSPLVDAISADWERNLDDVIDGINISALDEVAKAAFLAEADKIDRELRSRFTLERNTLVYLERNQRITDLILKQQPGYGKEGNLDDLVNNVIADTQGSLQAVDKALTEKLKTPDTLTSSDFDAINNDTWNQDVMNIIKQGLAKWEDAQRELYEKMSTWQDTAYASFEENNKKWEDAYTRLETAKNDWLASWDAQVQTALGEWNNKLTELSGNIEELNTSMAAYYGEQYTQWQNYTSGLYQMAASLPGMIASAQDNIAWLDSHKTSFTQYVDPMGSFIFWDPRSGIGSAHTVPEPEVNRCMRQDQWGGCIEFQTGFWYRGSWTWVSRSVRNDSGTYDDTYNNNAVASLQTRWWNDITSDIRNTIYNRVKSNDILLQMYTAGYFEQWIYHSRNRLSLQGNDGGMSTFTSNPLILLQTSGVINNSITDPVNEQDNYRLTINFYIDEDFAINDNNYKTYQDSYTYTAPGKYTLFHFQSEDWQKLRDSMTTIKNDTDSELLSNNGTNAGYLRNSYSEFGLAYDADGNLSTDTYLMTGAERSYELLRRELAYREKRLAIADELRKWAYPDQYPDDNPYIVNGERVSVTTLEQWMDEARGNKETYRQTYENNLGDAKNYYTNPDRDFQKAKQAYADYLTLKSGRAETLDTKKNNYLSAIKALMDMHETNPTGDSSALNDEVIRTRNEYKQAQADYDAIKNDTTTKDALDAAYNEYIRLMNGAQSAYNEYKNYEFAYEKAYSVWEYAHTPYLSDIENYDDSLLSAYVYSQGYNEETALGLEVPDAQKLYADMEEAYNQVYVALLDAEALRNEETKQYASFTALQSNTYANAQNTLYVDTENVLNESIGQIIWYGSFDPEYFKTEIRQIITSFLNTSNGEQPANGSREVLLLEQRSALQLLVKQLSVQNKLPDMIESTQLFNSIIHEQMSAINTELSSLTIDRPAESYTVADLYKNENYIASRNTVEALITAYTSGINSIMQETNEDTINSVINDILQPALNAYKNTCMGLMYTTDANGNPVLNKQAMTAVIRDREAVFKQLLVPIKNIDSSAQGGITLFTTVLNELLGSGGVYNDAIIALTDQTGELNGQVNDLVGDKAIERLNRWNEVTTYIRARGELDWDLGLIDFENKWKQWREQAITRIRNGENAWQDTVNNFHTASNTWKQDAVILSEQIGSKQAREKLQKMYNSIDSAIDAASKDIPLGIKLSIDTNELYKNTLVTMPAFDLGILKDSMQTIDVTAGFTEMLNLNLDFSTYTAFQKVMEVYTDKAVTMQSLRVGEMVEDTYKGFISSLHDANRQAREQMDQQIKEHPDFSKAPFEKKKRNWQIETISAKTASGTKHKTIAFKDFREFVNTSVFIQNGKTVDGKTIDFRDPKTYLDIDANELMIYADLEAKRQQEEIKKVFEGDEALFNVYAQEEGNRVMKDAGEAYVKYITGVALDNKIEKNGFNNVAYRAIFDGGPTVMTTVKTVATVVASVYGSPAAGVAVAAAFTAMEVASGNIKWQHALVQFAIEAAASYCGGAGFTGALAGMAIRTAASGIEYKDGGAIGWNSKKLGQGIKRNAVQFVLQQGVSAVAGSAGDAMGKAIAQGIGSFATSTIMSGLGTGGKWYEFNFDSDNIEQHLATGLASGLSSFATSALSGSKMMTSSGEHNVVMDKFISGAITSGINMLTGVSDSFNWDALAMNVTDIAEYAGQQFAQYTMEKAKQKEQRDKSGNPAAGSDPIDWLTQALGGILLSSRRFSNLMSGNGYMTDEELAEKKMFDAELANELTHNGGRDFALDTFLEYGGNIAGSLRSAGGASTKDMNVKDAQYLAYSKAYNDAKSRGMSDADAATYGRQKQSEFVSKHGKDGVVDVTAMGLSKNDIELGAKTLEFIAKNPNFDYSTDSRWNPALNQVDDSHLDGMYSPMDANNQISELGILDPANSLAIDPRILGTADKSTSIGRTVANIMTLPMNMLTMGQMSVGLDIIEHIAGNFSKHGFSGGLSQTGADITNLHQNKKALEQGSLITSMIPVAGDLKDLAQGFAGRDFIEGRDLSTFEQIASFASVLPIVTSKGVMKSFDMLNGAWKNCINRGDDVLRGVDDYVETASRLIADRSDIISKLHGTLSDYHAYTAGHTERTAQTTMDVVNTFRNELGFSYSDDLIHGAGLLHDIGKLYVPTELLDKSGRLNGVESFLIKEVHTMKGGEILDSAGLDSVYSLIARNHHNYKVMEEYNRIAGVEFTQEQKTLAKLFELNDVYDALRGPERSYQVGQGRMPDKKLFDIMSGIGDSDPVISKVLFSDNNYNPIYYEILMKNYSKYNK